ncbi:MAG: Uma2 family endonuclease [Deltaproteobacteria bacterium]|nr:Uma2 family endonuclease [Deltaproteobacteria bacterium]
MSGAAAKKATYADLLAAPEGKVAELLDGELIVSPRPAGRHSVAASALLGQLWPSFSLAKAGPSGWVILMEPEVHFGEKRRVLVPDLAGWRSSRLSDVGDLTYFTMVPNWICEILSPSTQRFDRVQKLAIYSDAGVDHVWLVDPKARTLEVLERRDKLWTIAATHADQEKVRGVPFETLEIDLSALWGPAP